MIRVLSFVLLSGLFLPTSSFAFDVENAQMRAQSLVDDQQVYDQYKNQAGLIAGMRPPRILGWVSKNSFGILDSLDHANDLTRGLSPSGFVSAIMQESMINILQSADLICEQGYDPAFDDLSTSSDGIDDGLAIQENLKKQGYLRKDYDGLSPVYSEDKKILKVKNESGDEYTLGRFKDLNAYTEFFAARYQWAHDQFMVSAKNLNIKLTNDIALISGWSYVFYNAGTKGGQNLLKTYGLRSLKGDGKTIGDVTTKDKSSRNPFANAKRVYALATFLEISEIVPAVNPHDPKVK